MIVAFAAVLNASPDKVAARRVMVVRRGVGAVGGLGLR